VIWLRRDQIELRAVDLESLLAYYLMRMRSLNIALPA